ncbi:hypothetical protein LSAT2_000923, partial [Lamellibrachia satsuma]
MVSGSRWLLRPSLSRKILMLKPNQSCPILVTIGADKDASAVLFEKDGGVDLINYLCKRCLNAVRRLKNMKRWTKCRLGWTENPETEQQLFGCIACLYDLEHSTFLMSEFPRRPLQTEQPEPFSVTLWPSQKAEHHVTHLGDSTCEASNCCRLTQLAIIATGPQSPLIYNTISATDNVNLSSPLPDMHTYSRQPDKEPQMLTQRPALLKLPVDVTCHRECSQQEEQQCHVQGELGANTDTCQWPTVVWQCFMKGTRVSFGGRSQEIWQLAENLAQQERLGTRISYASPHLR